MHIEMNRMWMDGTVGAWPLSGVLGSSVEFILWKTPLISAKYLTLFTLKMECKAQHKGMKPEYVCKNRATRLFIDAETGRNNNVTAETCLFHRLADICGPFLRARRVETLQ